MTWLVNFGKYFFVRKLLASHKVYVNSWQFACSCFVFRAIVEKCFLIVLALLKRLQPDFDKIKNDIVDNVKSCQQLT